MAIKVSCPSCGAKRTLPDVYRDRDITCPKCGTRFSATLSSAATDSASTSAAGRSDPIEESGEPLSNLFGTHTKVAPLAPRPEPRAPSGNHANEADQLGLEPSAPLQPITPPMNPPGPGTRREYKVLTRQNLWFTGHFDPIGFQEALNTFASQGWTLKSTMVLNVPGPEGPREEVVVILER